MQKEFFDSIRENKLNVIASRPLCGRLQLVLSFLEEYGVKQNKEISFYHFVDSSLWYTMKFVSYLSGIPYEKVRKFYYPLEAFNKGKMDFSREKLINTVEKLGSSSIFMEDFDFVLTSDTDIVDAFFDELGCFEVHSSILVIHTLDELIKKSNYPASEILLRFYNYAKYENVHFLFISDVDRSAEEKEKYTFSDINYYKELKGFGANFILSRRMDSSKCEIEYEIMNHDKTNCYSFTYDFSTNQIKEKFQNE